MSQVFLTPPPPSRSSEAWADTHVWCAFHWLVTLSKMADILTLTTGGIIRPCHLFPPFAGLPGSLHCPHSLHRIHQQWIFQFRTGGLGPSVRPHGRYWQKYLSFHAMLEGLSTVMINSLSWTLERFEIYNMTFAHNRWYEPKANVLGQLTLISLLFILKFWFNF